MQTRTKINLAIAHLGLPATSGLLTARRLDWSDFIKRLMVGLLPLPLLIAPLGWMHDEYEYVDSLWRAGTAWAFVAIVAVFVMPPVLQGARPGFSSVAGCAANLVQSTGYAAILMSILGLPIKWLRGRL